MTTLTDFLLARIAEDEAVAQDALEGLTAVGAHGVQVMGRPLYDPARALAECEAKRRIVESLIDMESVEDERKDQVVTLRWVCQSIALSYADHADYREEWRP